MKKFILTYLLALSSISMYSQYYDQSGYLSSLSISGSAQGLTGGFTNVDFKGNIFHLYGLDFCMGCNMTYSIYKSSPTGNNWSFGFPSNYNALPSASAFEDQNGHSYMIWETNDLFNVGNGLYNVSGGYNHALLKFNGNSLQWIIDFENGQKIYSDMNDNLYVQYSSNLFRMFDSTGVLTDSSLFTQQTKPAFMDSLGSFYRFSAGIITKFDFHNNVIWQNNYGTASMQYNMQGPHIFTCNLDSIYLVDLNGNIAYTYPNVLHISGMQFDLNGYYYTGLNQKHSLAGNLIYSIPPIGFSGFMDRSGKFYRWGSYSSHTGQNYTPQNLFLPPSVFNYPPPVTATYYGMKGNWYQVFNGDHLDTTINFNIYQGYTSLCTNNSISLSFSVDKYPPALVAGGFSVYLSDSSGNFSNSILLATSNYPPIQITIPATVTGGLNYAIKIVPNVSGFSASNNIISNIKILISPSPTIKYITGIMGNNGVLNGCDTMRFYTNTMPSITSYFWSRAILPLHSNGYYFGSTDTVFNYAAYSNYVVLKVTDSLGCVGKDSIYTNRFGYPFSINKPDTVNILLDSIAISSNYSSSYNIDTITGGNYIVPAQWPGNYYFKTYIAGPGWHYIYANIKNIVSPGMLLPCMADSIIDSIFVSSTPYAIIKNYGSTTVCLPDTAIAELNFSGSPPFTYWLKNNSNVRTGPFSAAQTLHYHKFVLNQGTYTFQVDSLQDALGSYTQAWSGSVYFNAKNVVTPIITSPGPLSFCLGDSVRLNLAGSMQNYLYQWAHNGVLMGTSLQNIYVYSAGIYTNIATYGGCTKSSNAIKVRVPCAPAPIPGGVSNDKADPDNEASVAEIILDASNIHILLSNDKSKLIIKAGKEFDIKQFNMMDVAGRIIVSSNTLSKNNSVHTYNLPHLNSGVYAAHIISSNKTFVKKIVIQ